MQKPTVSMLKRLSDQPLALLPAFARALPDVLADDGSIYGDSSERQYGLINGIAIIPVKGVLMKGGYNWYCSTTYDWIRAGVQTAVLDPEVRAIVFDIDSPGGEVTGCFDLVDMIYAARGRKPMHAILTESAYSAAYAIASACDKIIVPRTGGTGSVGVICMHVDVSKYLEDVGIAITMIHYGARKADGHSEIALSQVALDRFQADVDTMGELFVSTVARNRGLSIAQVKATEATTYLGAAGVEIGFADAVMAPDEAFRSLLSELGQ